MNQLLSVLGIASVLQVGQCTVDTAAREITGPSSPRVRRVTPKAMAVLHLLVAGAGQVVSREALLAGVWPDSAPTDDVLTQAITQLRKAFAGADVSQPYIETIARSGYRLLVNAKVLQCPPAPSLDDAVEAAQAPVVAVSRHPRQQWRRWRRWLLSGLAVVLVAVIAVLCWLLLQQRGSPAPLSGLDVDARPYRLLTSSLSIETQPALSPSGDWVAYTANVDAQQSQILLRQRIANSPSRVLSATPANAHDRLPSWSPDGSQIAFARFHGDGRCQLMLARVDGLAPPLELLDCTPAELLSFDFNADGSALVLGSFQAEGPQAGISLFDLARRRWQPLSYSRQPGDVDYSPKISPDGKWLVFARNPQLGRLYRMPAEGGALQALDADLLPSHGLTWLHDSRHIVVGRRIGMQSRLQRLDTNEPGQWQDLGVAGGQLPAAARQAPVLSFMHWRAQGSLTRFAAGQGAKPLYPSAGRELAPALSPDGAQLLMFSDRNGVAAVWLGDGQGRGPARLVLGLEPDVRQRASWDAGGSRALVTGKNGGLYEVSRSGAVVQLPVPVTPVLQAVYTDVPDQVLVLERGDDRGRLRLYDRGASPWRELARLDGVSQVQWDGHAGRVLYTRFASPGLFAWQAQSGQSQVVHAAWPTRWRYRSWHAAADGRIWYGHVTPACRNALSQLNPAASQVTGSPSAVRCLDAAVAASNGGLSVDPEGAVVMTQPLRDGGDIGLMVMSDTASGQPLKPSKLLIP